MLEPPADAELTNRNSAFADDSADDSTTNCCNFLPAFEQPVPEMTSGVSVGFGVVNVIVYAGAVPSNTICSMVALSADEKRRVGLDVALNVAVPVGTEPALQLAAVFQSVETGVADHVASPPASADFFLADIWETSGCVTFGARGVSGHRRRERGAQTYDRTMRVANRVALVRPGRD